MKAKVVGRNAIPPREQDTILSYFKCPACGHSPLVEKENALECSNCKQEWGMRDGIYDFREPIGGITKE